MMKTTRVVLYNQDISEVPILPERRCHPWFLNIIEKMIDYLSSFDTRGRTEEITCTEVVLFSRILSDLCFDQYERVWELTNKAPKILLIGRDEWKKLHGELIKQPFSFMFEPDYRMGSGYKVLGMRVVVVPWISGLFCLPNLRDM